VGKKMPVRQRRELTAEMSQELSSVIQSYMPVKGPLSRDVTDAMLLALTCTIANVVRCGVPRTYDDRTSTLSKMHVFLHTELTSEFLPL
jgi:hypothetical protein